MSTRFARTLLAIFAGSMWLLAAGCSSPPPGTYKTPEEAIQALAALIPARGDNARIEEMFGPGSVDLFASGDADVDREDFERVGERIRAKVEFEDFDATTKIAMLGEDGWPWPIPLVQTDGRWHFDTAAGREELLNRRIGRNELWTLTSLHAGVDAQKEYASESRDGNAKAFAQRFRSTEGRHDGLYWPVSQGEAPSPLGDLLAESEFRSRSSDAGPQPYYGYFYRIVTAQGKSAPGGARSYLDKKGLLSDGFAIIAWPDKYGNSGVMTFMISHDGIAYQKDLGADTAALASAMDAFDPDVSWTPTRDSVEATVGDE